MENLKPHQVIGHGHFFHKTLMSRGKFVDFCKKRGLDISRDRLERFEQLGIFYPMLYVDHPRILIKRKMKESLGDEIVTEEFGILGDGEIWKGELREDYSAFLPFDKDQRDSWIDQRLVSVPSTTLRDQPGITHSQSDRRREVYYSMFQTLPLHVLRQILTMESRIEDLATRTQKEAAEFQRRYKKAFKNQIASLRDANNAWDKYARICQVLSHRYLPYAESDGLTVSVPSRSFTDFDFFAFRREWNPADCLNEIGLSSEDIAKAWEGVSGQADWINPLSSWIHLLDMVTKEKRKELKGAALMGETWRTMSRMLNLFYEDLTDRRLHTRREAPEVIELYRGKGVTKDHFRYREFVANEFGVNPKPKLILMVEGEGEFQQLPRLVLWAFGKSFAAYRIQLVNLKSIGEFSSKKVERFIDHFHDLQTIVFFILDNENNSVQTRDRLIRTKSQYIENLTLTHSDFFAIWNRNVEFDNFTDNEIAEAMTQVSQNRYHFNETELSTARSGFGSKGDPLSSLYREKLNGYDLDKPKLLSRLFDTLEANHKMLIDGSEVNRPIINVIEKVTRLAIRNYQPASIDVWTDNQNSGFLRTKLEEKG